MTIHRLARLVWSNLVIWIALGGFGVGSAAAQTQGHDGIGSAAVGECLCGNESGTAFPDGQCFVDRTCEEALAETGGNPCMGVGQGNCPAGQYCLDANNGCGMPTCALQTLACGGACSTGTGVAPYGSCGGGSPQDVPASSPATVALAVLLLGALGVITLRRLTAGARRSP